MRASQVAVPCLLLILFAGERNGYCCSLLVILAVYLIDLVGLSFVLAVFNVLAGVPRDAHQPPNALGCLDNSPSSSNVDIKTKQDILIFFPPACGGSMVGIVWVGQCVVSYSDGRPIPKYHGGGPCIGHSFINWIYNAFGHVLIGRMCWFRRFCPSMQLDQGCLPRWQSFAHQVRLHGT